MVMEVEILGVLPWEVNVINATFADCTGSNGGQSYPDNIPVNNAETGATITGLPDFYGSGDGTDLYQIVRSAPNTGSTYTIQFTGSGLQNLNDESWAIDNVKIYLYSNNVVSDIQWSTGETTETITVSPTETTTYTVTVDNGLSLCQSEVDVEVLNAQILQNDTTICFGDSVELSVLSPGPIQECSLPTNLQNGLVGYWPFCGNANDESGNGNDGTVNGATLTTDSLVTLIMLTVLME